MSDHGTGYWTWRRLSRRGVLRGAAPAATAARPAATASPAAVQPKLGGKLATMATTIEQHMDPHTTGGPGGGISMIICYSQLMTFKWGPDIKPPSYIAEGDLAESWQQPDDTSFLFKIRSGARFHNLPPVNGRELDADDIRVSFERIIAKKVGAGNLANVAKIEAVDKSTLKLTLDKPNADLLANLANANQMVIIARELADKELNDGPTIGTGAWIFESHERAQRTVLKKNPDYFRRGTPYADTWESFRTSDPSQVVNAFRGGEVNVIGSGMTASSGNDVIKAVPRAQVIWIPLTINPNELSLNAKTDTFRDKRVRQAIHKAIDRKAIFEAVFLGRAGYNAGLLVPDPDWNLPDAELQRLQGRDLAGARQLLRDAGKEGLEFEALAANYLQGAYIAMAEVVQANLKEIGVTMNIKPIDAITSTQLQTSGNFTAHFGAFAGGFPNFLLYSRYSTNGPNNYVGTANPDLDKLIDQQAVLTRDPAARKRILQEIQRLIIDDATHITLGVYEQPTIAQPEVRNFYPPTGVNSHNLFWSRLWLDK